MSARTPTSSVIVPLILVVAFGAVLMAMLRQRTELEQTRAEYEQLLQARRSVPDAPTDAPAAAERPAERAPGATATPPEAAPSHPPVSSPSFFGPIQSTGLELAGTHVVPHEGALKATMRFFPTQSEPPGMVAVVVRLPKESESRIVDLAPGNSAMTFTDIGMRVADDGKFAIWHGTAENAETLEIALTVSGEVVADVRGTAGIGPFDLAIDPVETSTTPK